MTPFGNYTLRGNLDVIYYSPQNGGANTPFATFCSPLAMPRQEYFYHKYGCLATNP